MKITKYSIEHFMLWTDEKKNQKPEYLILYNGIDIHLSLIFIHNSSNCLKWLTTLMMVKFSTTTPIKSWTLDCKCMSFANNISQSQIFVMKFIETEMTILVSCWRHFSSEMTRTITQTHTESLRSFMCNSTLSNLWHMKLKKKKKLYSHGSAISFVI